MEKKNTMLLTVIAVATLLVAVVGATFAFYGIIGANTSSSTSLTGNTGYQVGLVTLNNEETALKLFVTDEDMSKLNQGTTYHAVVASATANTKGSNGAKSSGSYYTTSANQIDVSSVRVTNGSAEAMYQCVSKVTVTFGGTAPVSNATAETEDIFNHMVAGDAKVTFKMTNHNAVVLDQDGLITAPSGSDSYATIADNTATTATAKDIKTVYGGSGHTVEYDLVYHLTGAGAYSVLSADIEIDNTAVDQSELSGGTLTATITNTGFSCDVVDAHAFNFNALGQNVTAPAHNTVS